MNAIANTANWLFEPSRPTNLAVCRIILFCYLVYDAIRFNYGAIVVTSLDDWFPVSYFWLLNLPPTNKDLCHGFFVVFQVSLVLSAIGLFTRTNCLLAFVLGCYYLGLSSNFGKIGHGYVLTIFTLAAFAFSHSGDALSLDAILRRWRRQQPDSPILPALSGEYTWPIRLTQIMFCLLFMAAGWSKLRVSGLDWIFSDNLQNILLLHFYCGHSPPTEWGRWVAQFPFVCQGLAAMAVFLELFAPLALLSRKLRFFFIASLFSMQIGIWLLMGVFSVPWLLTYIIWVPWHSLLEKSLAMFNWHSAHATPFETHQAGPSYSSTS